MEKKMAKERKEEEKREGGAYEKTLLYLYPHLDKMSAALDTSLRTQAVLSYRRRESAEALVERLLLSDFQSAFLLQTKAELDGLLGAFPQEDRFVLEYRYFRRKRYMRVYEREAFRMSLRTFYRRQHRVLQKFSAALHRRGMDEKWFLDNFSQMDWAMRVYEKVRAGRDSYLLGKYKNSPFFRTDKNTEKEEEEASMPV